MGKRRETQLQEKSQMGMRRVDWQKTTLDKEKIVSRGRGGRQLMKKDRHHSEVGTR